MSIDKETQDTASQAQALGRWLDQPGQEAPESLDDDVVEAMFALRPDLAPAAQVSVEDILSGVKAGPLGANNADDPESATGSHEGAEILHFPGADEGESEDPASEAGTSQEATGTRNRTALWAGGVSSVGVVLVAAATLLLVVMPDATPDLAEVAAAPTATETAAAPPLRPATPKKVELDKQIAEALEPKGKREPAASSLAKPQSQVADGQMEQRAARPAAEPAARQRFAPADPESRGARARDNQDDLARQLDLDELNEGYAIDQQPSPLGSPAIPELAGGLGTATEEVENAVAQADKEQSASRGLVPAEPVAPVVARPTDVVWRSKVDAATEEAVEEQLQAARELSVEGRHGAAAQLLSEAVQDPPALAHHLAAQAAEYYLQAGNAAAAARVAQAGLAYGKDHTPGRQYLWYLLGQAREAIGDSSGATEAWNEIQ